MTRVLMTLVMLAVAVVAGAAPAAGEAQTGGSEALAWVWFVGGTRRDEMHVSVSAARRLVGATRVGGRAVSAWPPAMRASFTPTDLVSSRRQRFGLSAEVVRLLATYCRQVPSGPMG